jgi:hypothetical protein
MASTYTTNLGIEKIGSGEQAGSWGNTTNNNFELIDNAVNGVVTISVSGATTKTVTTSSGTLSEGGRKVLVFTGSPGGDCTVTISPPEAEKMYFIDNQADQKLIIRQGTGTIGNGRAVEVAASSKGFIYADGTGSSNAKVVDLLNGITFGNTKLTTTATELNIIDGGTSATSTTVVDADRLVLNDDGTMVQAAVTDLSTYFNQNLVEVKSLATISGALNVIAGGPTSVYQQIVVSSGTQTVNVQTDNLVAGQYVMIDKKTSANKITINWNAGDGSTALSGGNVSTGISLGDSVDLAIGIFNGTFFSFTETVKF